jgi:hypothetical protein
MRRNTERVVATFVGFVISSPVGFLLFHKPEAVGWGLDPWLLLGAIVSGPGILVGTALAGQNQVVKLVLAFLFCWVFYGTICYFALLLFRRKA